MGEGIVGTTGGSTDRMMGGSIERTTGGGIDHTTDIKERMTGGVKDCMMGSGFNNICFVQSHNNNKKYGSVFPVLKIFKQFSTIHPGDHRT